ncbi:MAG: hypothetical protein KAJ07_00545 [Planctomycetes bacterium]|nr:hypothetical protein [Planctomycetota bacterium]
MSGEPTASREAEVPRELKLLEDALSDIAGSVGRLENRIEPAMRGITHVPESDLKPETEVSSELAGKIHQSVDLARRISKDIDKITERIEL